MNFYRLIINFMPPQKNLDLTRQVFNGIFHFPHLEGAKKNSKNGILKLLHKKFNEAKKVKSGQQVIML